MEETTGVRAKRTEWLEGLDVDGPPPSTLTTEYPPTPMVDSPQLITTPGRNRFNLTTITEGDTPTLKGDAPALKGDAPTTKSDIPSLEEVLSPDSDSIPVFNRTDGLLGFSTSDFPYVELKPGQWQSVNKRFAYEYLLSNPAVTVRLPYYSPTPRGKDHLTIAAPCDAATGYGVMASNITNEIAKLKGGTFKQVRTKFGYDEPETFWNTELCPVYLFPLAHWNSGYVPPLVQSLMQKQYKVTDTALAITLPTELELVPSKTIVLFSMWETRQLPKGWGDIVNEKCKALMLPSESQVAIWRDGGVTIPVHIVPLGVDVDVFKYQERPKRADDEPFKILCYGLLGTRKSPTETLVEVCWAAFSRAYGEPVDDWSITFKTRHNVFGGGTSVSDPHVKIINADYPPEDMARLCYEADCGIILSKYEGFGLPFREMMSTGLPVIVSANSGHLSDCDAELNYPIPTAEIIPAQEMYSKDNWQWEEPDYARAAMVLRAEYEAWKSRGRTQSVLGTRAARYIAVNRTWKQTAQGILKVVEEIQNG